MRKLFFFLLPIICISVSCSKESGSITGSWVTEMADQPQHSSGFTLKDDGTAASINQHEKAYQKWEKQGNRLLLFGKYTSSQESNDFTDTLKIISAGDSALVLENSSKEKITYQKTMEADQLVSKFETYLCFAYYSKKDTAFMHININNNVVTGTLEYAIFEKDANDGKIKGTVQGDTLLAQYTFNSEGVESTREVAFLKKGDDWQEGFGDVEDKQGSMVFKNRSKLNFQKGMLFKQVECP